MEIKKREERALFSESENKIYSRAELLNLGLGSKGIENLLEEERIIKISKGLYASPRRNHMYLYFAKRLPKGIFSHASAWYLWGLTDTAPKEYHMTVKSGASAVRITTEREDIKIHYIKSDILELGKTSLALGEGEKIPLYDLERSLLDMLRYKKYIEYEVFHRGIKKYFSLPQKNIRRLLQYAGKLGVKEKILLYMEVLI